MKNFCVFFGAAALLVSCGGCSLDSGPDGDAAYTFLSYNVCNLFDDAADGTEYAEFDPSRGAWTSADYKKKLDAVGRVIAGAAGGGADFAALVELENDRVLADLCAGPLKECGYRFGVTLPTDSSAIRVGFLSRFPVRDIRGHTPPSSGFHQRAIMEVTLDVGGEELVVFICHFKAKTEGSQATEKSRILSASTLARRIREKSAFSSAEILVLGDLNENADEYERNGGTYITALMPASAALDAAGALESVYLTGEKSAASFAGPLVFYSPWLDDPPHPGSYYYHSSWETIDHALVSPGLVDSRGLVFLSFGVVRHDFMLTSGGAPKKEFSDHLPLLVRLGKAEN
ncbi:MAG: endonuclease/exonuclease/phosphatase family protein [Spirochaetales bacterium]|nr:endonuclease/exonuclease/phosphatase family protein [Spirochaetales bacterium]